MGREQWCPDCTQLATGSAGQAVAVAYEYFAAEVATALFAVATGSTYSAATKVARADHADRTGASARINARPAMPRPATRKRRRNRPPQGQLVADWVEVYSNTLAPRPTSWPSVVLLDSTKFFGSGRRLCFEVMLAFGYDLDVRGRLVSGRLLLAHAVKRATTAEWLSLLQSLAGQPIHVVTDADSQLMPAVHQAWGQGVHVRCTWHWAENLRDAVRADLNAARYDRVAIERHPLVRDAERAFTSAGEWQLYRTACELEFAGVAGASATPRWFRANERQALAQMAARANRPPVHSTGPLEAHIAALRPYLADRATGFTNPTRLNLLLQVMVGATWPGASARSWSKQLLVHLHLRASRPVRRQREVVGDTF